MIEPIFDYLLADHDPLMVAFGAYLIIQTAAQNRAIVTLARAIDGVPDERVRRNLQPFRSRVLTNGNDS